MRERLVSSCHRCEEYTKAYPVQTPVGPRNPCLGKETGLAAWNRAFGGGQPPAFPLSSCPPPPPVIGARVGFLDRASVCGQIGADVREALGDLHTPPRGVPRVRLGRSPFRPALLRDP